MSDKFTGLIITLTDKNGKETVYYGKTEKGLMRDHRKHKCKWDCCYCYNEGMDYLEKYGQTTRI